MENFHSSGEFTKQAHVKIPEGLYEEEHGRKGFFGRVAQLYHENPLTGWTKIEGNLKPRQLPNIFELSLVQDNFQVALFNNDVTFSYATFNKKLKNFQRNADFDELFFIHTGNGCIETSFGPLKYVKGDYIMIPRGTTYKFYPSDKTQLIRIESASEFEQPTRGILGPNALYDQTAIEIPSAQIGSEKGNEFTVEIRYDGESTFVTYPFNPLDVRGWKGSLYPFKISIYDYCPINSHRYHIPPSGHSMFVAKNFVICSFVARPLEHASEKVLKVPFYHLNIDYDEVLFYHEGDFFSRDNITSGSITFHPQGIHHGPHPKAFKNADDKIFTNEFAVMLDTRNPLKRTEFFNKYENQEYWKSWMSK